MPHRSRGGCFLRQQRDRANFQRSNFFCARRFRATRTPSGACNSFVARFPGFRPCSLRERGSVSASSHFQIFPWTLASMETQGNTIYEANFGNVALPQRLGQEGTPGVPWLLSRSVSAHRILTKRRCRQTWHRTGRCRSSNRVRSDGRIRDRRTLDDPHRGQIIESPRLAQAKKFFSAPGEASLG
jgi:hypothetical protein